MKAFFADNVPLLLPPGHRFPADKYRLLRERVLAQLSELDLAASKPASPGELALAHSPSYIADVIDGRLSQAQLREIGFPASPLMAERACRSVGASIQAARAALIDGQGVAANLAGGTHHAKADAGGGYCVFNDVAVALRLMQSEWHRVHRKLLRVAVIDLDVHQGNGTASIFQDDDTVFTLSMHGAKNFPFRKSAGDLDVELPDGCGDEAYLAALDQAMVQLWQRHADALPGLVFYLAGADAHEGDRLGRLKLTTAGMAERDRRVFTSAREKAIPLALAMGGGYGHDIGTTVDVQINTLREALKSWQRWNNPAP